MSAARTVRQIASFALFGLISIGLPAWMMVSPAVESDAADAFELMAVRSNSRTNSRVMRAVIPHRASANASSTASGSTPALNAALTGFGEKEHAARGGFGGPLTC